jgi:hypothetical protein
MMDAGAAIVPAAVPGADEKVALEDALAEGASAAGTDAIERVDFPIEIAECVRMTVYGYLGSCGRGKGGKRKYFDERH